MSAAQPMVELRGVKKSFDGVDAVRGVSFEIPAGQVVGFIGANGAGKTTTMRMMATLEIADEGEIRVDGWDVREHPGEVRRLVGWMPDSFGTYAHVTVFDYLDFYARACGYRREERRRRVAEVMEFADLSALADRPMNGLSKGMAQRLCFGRTILHDPRLLILDEPAAGLDPKARLEFKNLVRLLKERGLTIFISSHILSELGEMCDALLFIDQGRVVHHGTAESLQETQGNGACLLEIQVDGSEQPLLQWLSQQPGWRVLDQSQGAVRAEYTSALRSDLAVVLRRMVQDGIRVSEFRRQERRLEELFVDVLRNQPREGQTPAQGRNNG
jgi:ABC-2 type transport system ATP-binding protein